MTPSSVQVIFGPSCLQREVDAAERFRTHIKAPLQCIRALTFRFEARGVIWGPTGDLRPPEDASRGGGGHWPWAAGFPPRAVPAKQSPAPGCRRARPRPAGWVGHTGLGTVGRGLAAGLSLGSLLGPADAVALRRLELGPPTGRPVAMATPPGPPLPATNMEAPACLLGHVPAAGAGEQSGARENSGPLPARKELSR